MHIRCERCSTVYELDEKLVPAEGALVQCTRCEHVFTAKRPGVAEPPRAPEPRAPAAATRPPGEPPPAAPPEPPEVPPPATEPEPASEEVAPRPDAGPEPLPEPPRLSTLEGPDEDLAGPPRGGKAEGRAPPPVPPWARSSASAPPGLSVPMSTAYRSSVQRMRSTRRVGRGSLRWVAVAVAVIAALALAAWAVHHWMQGRADPGAAAKRKDGHALLLRDDSGSLEAAAEAFAAAASLDGSLYQAEADVALARVLELSDLSWEGARVQDAFARDAAELARLRGQRAPEADRREAELSARRKALSARYDELRELGSRREAAAKASLSSLLRDHPDDVAVLRAVALYHAVGGRLDLAAQVLARADAERLSDPWLELARASANAAARDLPRRDRGIAGLQELARAHPDLLRARLLAARALVAADRRDEALRTLSELLRRNPQHDQARSLAAELAPVPTPPAQAIAAAEPPLAAAARNPPGPAR